MDKDNPLNKGLGIIFFVSVIMLIAALIGVVAEWAFKRSGIDKVWKRKIAPPIKPRHTKPYAKRKVGKK